jgi:hypothetical protein
VVYEDMCEAGELCPALARFRCRMYPHVSTTSAAAISSSSATPSVR